MAKKKVGLPVQGIEKEKLLAMLDELHGEDAQWQSGKTWSLVYFVSESHAEVLKAAYTAFFYENGLSPIAFPSLKRFEAEVISMTADLLNGDEAVVGTMTSGGTESITMAMKTYRDWARKEHPEIKEPEAVLPITVHPAFEKAAHYLGVKVIHVPLRDDFRADVEAAKAAITPNTIMMAGSAPGYPFGVIDPIPELAALAAERNIGFHVDACLGGFLLPFIKRAGYAIPDFDFTVPGVTSISADLHKYGFAARGASTVLYRSNDWLKHQFFVYTEWPGGLYGSPSMAGSRPGGAIAAAWASLQSLGESGYTSLAKKIMRTAETLIEGIEKIKGIHILGEPDMSVFSFEGEDVDIFAVGDVMEKKGWHIDRQQKPNALHLMVTPAHESIADQFLQDLKASVEYVHQHPEVAKEGSAPMYGMMASLPDRTTVHDFVLQFLLDLYKV